MQVTSLGHAGLKVETTNSTVLVDPWFNPEGAFLASWFQYPNNQHLMTPSLLEADAIIISHEHLDHIDPWFLAQVPRHIPVIIPNYSSPVLYHKIMATGSRKIVEAEPWQAIEIAPGTQVFFVPETSPMNHDAAIVIRGDGQNLLDLNDARLSPAQLRSIRAQVGGTIHLLTLQGAGASWYPLCYDYEPEHRQKLSRHKRIAKLNYAARVITILEPITAVPFAGPPCFLDPDLVVFNAELEGGIFPDAQQVADWLRGKGIQNTTVLLPGDRWNITKQSKEADPHWHDFSFCDRQFYIQDYAKCRANSITEAIARYPVPTQSLWQPFQDYFQHLLGLNPYFNQKIGMRVGFDITGAGGGQWAIDFRPGHEAVLDEMKDCSYGYRFASRWLVPLLQNELPWEDFFLSLRFQAWRHPDIYNDHLLGLLKFAHPHTLSVIEQYETSLSSTEQITIQAEGKAYQVQRYCPHAGIDLLEAGEVISGGILRCLGHHYEFDLETGKCLNGNCQSLRVFNRMEKHHERY